VVVVVVASPLDSCVEIPSSVSNAEAGRIKDHHPKFEDCNKVVVVAGGMSESVAVVANILNICRLDESCTSLILLSFLLPAKTEILLDVDDDAI